jgi:ligand-binding SRPBCC domain-containing protein
MADFSSPAQKDADGVPAVMCGGPMRWRRLVWPMRMRYTFVTGQWVPYRVELVFAFFANPQNLPCLMPAWQYPRIEKASYVAPPPRPHAADEGLHLAGFAAGAGSQFTLSFRPFPWSPIRLAWEAYIAEFEWNDHFCDEQRRGPFGYWRHCHRVVRQSQGDLVGTSIADELAYELPFGLFSRQANALVVAGQIRSIFKFRQASLEKHLAQLARQWRTPE